MSVIARARRVLADAIARLLARWQRRRKAWERTTDETRRARSIQPTRQLRARSASSATLPVSALLSPPSLPAQMEVPAPRHHRIGRIGPPNLHTVTVECECGWAVTLDRLDNALNAFDSHAATATAQPKGKN
jgi:hypothetical protein